MSRPFGKKDSKPRKESVYLNEQERADAKVLVARLWRMGFSQTEIQVRVAEDIAEVSVGTIGKLQQEIRMDYKELAVDEMRERQIQVLATLSDIRREAYLEWEKSKKEWSRVQTEELNNMSGEGGYTKTTVTKELRAAAAEFMRIILDTVKQERELLGLDAPVKIDAKMKAESEVTHKFSWDDLMLSADTPGKAVDLMIEQAVKERVALPESVETIPQPSSTTKPSNKIKGRS